MSEIVVLCEGATEKGLKEALKVFLDGECVRAGKDRMRLTLVPTNGGSELLKADRLSALVNRHLSRPGVVGVIGLVDVVAPGVRTRFANAAEAIATLRSLMQSEPRFHPHAAQHDVEAWLLPYWATACRKVNRQQRAPGASPEAVNHGHPPSYHLNELYRLAGKRYDKPRDAAAILRGQDLRVAANACPQFKAFLNTLLDLSGCPQIP